MEDSKRKIKKERTKHPRRLIDACPLFGPIPAENPIPKSPINRCVEIIVKSRAMWGIYPPWRRFAEFCPRKELISDYPEEMLAAAREINKFHSLIRQKATLRWPRLFREPAWHEMEDGRYEERHTIDTAWKYAIEAARFFCDGVEKFGSIPDYAILAILAIHDAYWTLHLIIDDHEPEDNREVKERLQNALLLYQKAESLKSQSEKMEFEEKIKKKDGEIKKLRPHAERGKRVLRGAKKRGRATNKNYRIANSLYQKVAEEIWAEEPLLDNSKTARKIINRIDRANRHAEESGRDDWDPNNPINQLALHISDEGLTPNWRTIRRNIRKPSNKARK